MTTLQKEEVRYFYEDEIYRIKRNGAVQFGMVIEDSEFASSDEDSDGEEKEMLVAGRIRVAWHPNGEEEVVREKNVGLADRSLMPGDVVRRLIAGKDTQRGYCRDVNVRASVEIVGTQQVVFDVASKDLNPLEEFTVDVAVCLGSWVGMIKSIDLTLTLKFSDGSICEISDEDASELEDLTDKRDDDCEFKRYDFYPGQVLSGQLKDFELANFTFCSEEMKNLRNASNSKMKSCNLKAVVDKVKVTSVNVNWQCQAYAKDSQSLADLNDRQPMPVIQEAQLEKLKMLNVFEPCTLQIGDRNYYTLKKKDIIMMREEWRKLEKESYLKVGSSSKKTVNIKTSDMIKKRPEVEESTADEADVSDTEKLKYCRKEVLTFPGVSPKKRPSTAPSRLVSDKKEETAKATLTPHNTSTSSTSSKAKTSVPASTLSKKKKLRRSRKNSDRSTVTTSFVDLKPGDKVIVETLCTRSEATVVWQDGSIEEKIASRELYPIHALDDQEFFPGDFVVRTSINSELGGKYTYDPHSYGVIQSTDHLGRTCTVKWFRTYTTGNEPQPLFVGTTLEPVYDLKDHPDFKYRPGSIVIRVANFNDMSDCTGGQVLDNYTSGQVLVWWANNATSACWPQDLYKIGEYDSDDGELWDDNDSDSDEEGNQSGESWETESEHSVKDQDPSVNFNIDMDDSNMRSKLAASIERAGIAITKLENTYNDKTGSTSANCAKGVLEVYKNCKCLDNFMGTSFFDESIFDDLLSKVKERSKLTVQQQAVKEHMERLFSEESNQVITEKSTDTPTDTDSNNQQPKQESSEELNVICAKLCTLMKAQLVESHDEVMSRCGGQAANFTADDLTQSPGEQDFDLQDLMRKLSTTEKEESQKSDQATVKEDGDNTGPTTAGAFGLYKTKGVSNYDISTALYGAKDDSLNVTASSEVEDVGEFSMIEHVQSNHKFKLSVFQPNDPKNFIKFVRLEVKLLRSSLPTGIQVKGFEDRVDLYSVMIKGPKGTPYEDGLFFFDFQLSADYPKAPPICHYHSYVTDRLNPNLYEDGKVCVSLLGTWSGKGTETWTPNSNLLQLLVSIQGLILVNEPYFNEAGYERQKGTQQGHENSRMYNEMVVLKMVQAMTRLALHPPEAFKDEIQQHLKEYAQSMIDRIENWRQMSLNAAHCSSSTTPDDDLSLAKGPESFKIFGEKMPDFPLVPASRGFCLSLDSSLEKFKTALKASNLL